MTSQGNVERKLTLIFKNVTEGDAGSYVCKVTIGTRPTFREVDIAVQRKFV